MSATLHAIRSCAVLAAMLLPASAQRLQDRYTEAARGWESSLEKGEGASVRRAAEAMLTRESPLAGAADYNDQRVLVALHDMAARGAVLEGAWEDAVAFLDKAALLSKSNASQAEKTLGNVLQDHAQHLTQTRASMAQIEGRLKEIDQMLQKEGGLPKEVLDAQAQGRLALDQHKASIAHSERSQTEIRSVLDQLRNVQDTYVKSSTAWKGFLEKEKTEIAQAGSSKTYVVEKLQQIKADDAKPRSERLAYGRRLLRLDPANGDARRFVDSLLGLEPAEPPSAPEPRKSVRKSRKRR